MAKKPTAPIAYRGVAQSERPKRTGRGGRVMDMAVANTILEIILSGEDVTDGTEYADDKTARAEAVKAARYLTAAIKAAGGIENSDGVRQVAGTRIKNGQWYLFLTNPRQKRKPKATPEA
jgi:hypothetical protein